MAEKIPVIELKNVYYQYNYEKVLENIQLKVHAGDFLAIVGPNGSGKSTLLKLILGLLKDFEGEIYLFGEKISSFHNWGKIGFVSQKANAFNTAFPASVYEVVRSGLAKQLNLFQYFSKNYTKERVYKALEAVDMLQFKDRNIGELSGGQQQRVFIARAIISEPEILILDEPTVGVDAKRVQDFYKLLDQFHKKGMTIILVTHDVGTISNKVSHVACLNRVLHFHGNSKEYEQLEKENFTSFYGHEVNLISHDHGGDH